MALRAWGPRRSKAWLLQRHRDVEAGDGFKRTRRTGHGRHSSIQTPRFAQASCGLSLYPEIYL